MEGWFGTAEGSPCLCRCQRHGGDKRSPGIGGVALRVEDF